MKAAYTSVVKKVRGGCFIPFPKEMLQDWNLKVGDEVLVDFKEKGRVQMCICDKKK